ncbi:histone deacetylase 6-like isoform X2 [Octopus sinensis]|uniref:Histone deacetylase 6-like isoform X2 n=1 Tax=Octopus sinensis TaxID=2607531 RepID=A0A7E6FGS3_9MOLL|nr:histone deacetylase 6-like isoform X2 [Octopus sinensis]
MDSNSTGFIYNPEMTKHECFWIPDFTEQPQRVIQPFKRCNELNLIERCQQLDSCVGTEEMALLQHSKNLIDSLIKTEEMDNEELKEFSTKYDSLYFHKDTNKCAWIALGCTVKLVDKVIENEIRNGFALVRPPGHHALYNEFCGYCYLNNVGIAAAHALSKGVERILIVDWDVHHGQATQYSYYDDPHVLYFSIHRYQNGQFWPCLRQSDYDFVGKGPGLGFNINVPLNKIGLTESDYLAIFHHILMPVASEFNPQLVLISAGFDSAFGDIKGQMSVSPMAYAHFTHMLSTLANGKICTILEGGYCLKSLAEGVAYSIKSLLGDPCPDLGPLAPPSDSVAESILNVIKVHRNYWSRLRHQSYGQHPDECAYPDLWTMPPKEGIIFCTEENQPDVHILTNETLPLEEVEMCDKQLNEMIQSQPTDVPTIRTAVCFDPSMETFKDLSHELQGFSRFQKLLPRLHVIENTDNASELVHPMIERKIQNGVFVSLQKNAASPKSSYTILQHHLQHQHLQRILYVDLCPDQDSVKNCIFLMEKGVLYLPVWVNTSEMSEMSTPEFSINVTCDEIGDGEYMAVFHQIILPLAYQFGPQLVVLSAKLSSQKLLPLTSTGLSHLVHLLKVLAAGKLILFVEDGQCLTKEWDQNLEACTLALLGDKLKPLKLHEVNSRTLSSISSFQNQFKESWPCFKFQVPIPKIEKTGN